MIVRALDSSGDWTFGSGLNNYCSGNVAVAQDIQTRLSSFLGDCFFDLSAGIDWFTFLGGKNSVALNLAISAVILNTNNVTGILQLSSSVNSSTRLFTITYQVETTYSVLSSTFAYDMNA